LGVTNTYGVNSMDRLQQKSDLLIKLGALFGPLQRLVEVPGDYNEQERAEVIARYCAEWSELTARFSSFCRGQPGHYYAVEAHRFAAALMGVKTDVSTCRDLADVLPSRLRKARSAIDAVPVTGDSVILEAGSPFTAYCKIKDLCEADTTRDLAVVDAYMNDSFFHRFLHRVRSDASITLVTSDLRPGAGPRDRQRHYEFLDISRLFAQERDPAHYRLVLQPAGVLHDRWMRFDNKRLVSLGGSSKDAGDRQYFTVAALDATPANLLAFQAHLDSGTEYYGPSTPTHR
jgi:hypothetical protein